MNITIENEHLSQVYQGLVQRNQGDEEFLQAAREILSSLVPVAERRPDLVEAGIFRRFVEPERMIQFRVTWMDDAGQVQVNRAYRVQYNSAVGPYKGGLRFHPSVNASIVKFLAIEQTLKDSLTGLPMGGGKGGADFDPKGKSDAEVMRFCKSYMTELSRHIGADTDVPGGDIGVGGREIGYLYGQYKRICNKNCGCITGKSIYSGGSYVRTEATGYGLCYFTEEMLKSRGMSLKGKRIVISGSGNVAIYATQKAAALGATIVALSDSNGYVYDPKGINLHAIRVIKEEKRERISEYLKYEPDAAYAAGSQNIWKIPCDIAFPCATQNELNLESVKTLISNGCVAIGEGANMPTTEEAVDYIMGKGILFAPAKAANAGGVAVSGLEMSQNSIRTTWSFDEVDERLQKIMVGIYHNCCNAAESYGYSGNLVVGANIAGFMKVAEAMLWQGIDL